MQLISSDNVRRLFADLDPDEAGLVPLGQALKLLMSKPEPPLEEHVARQVLAPLHEGHLLEESRTTMEELVDVFEHGPGLAVLVERSKVFSGSMTREHLVRTIVNSTDRNDALMTLPLTLAYIIIFIFLVMGHLAIHERQLMEKALEAWVNGREPFTTCTEDVDSIGSFWKWFLADEDGLAGIFAVKRITNSTQYVLASRNVLLGDVKLSRLSRTGEEQTVWLIRSAPGQEFLRQNPDNHLGAAQVAARHLKVVEKWDDPSVHKMWVSLSTYNDLVGMFAMVQVLVTFGHYGEVYPVINAEAVSIMPYRPSQPVIYVMDCLFVLMVLYLTFIETKDMLASLRMGCGEFIDYWAFWNVVDWISIVLGFASIVIWAGCCMSMRDEDLLCLLDADGDLNLDVMGLGSAKLDSVMSKLARLRYMYMGLHLVMALNTISIVMKFFKAFTANARLRVVTDTFNHATVDFAHFGIIFATIFLPFTIIGHVLFGNDVDEFSSFPGSINTGLKVLMGDFGWYSLLTQKSTIVTLLPSGMPVLILFLWYILYMFLVLLVLLNMLLAIIIEHYTQVTSKLAGECAPIWTQIRRFLKYKKETRRFVPLVNIRRKLENDNDPSHPEPEVTLDSLLAAFPGMDSRQGLWLLNFLRRSISDAEAAGMGLSDLADMLSEQGVVLREVADVVGTGRTRDTLEERALRSRGPSAKPDELGRMGRKLDELCESVAKLRRDQAGLARRVDEACRSMLKASDLKDRQAPIGTEGVRLEPRPELGAALDRRRPSGPGVKLRDRERTPSTGGAGSKPSRPKANGRRAPEREKE